MNGSRRRALRVGVVLGDTVIAEQTLEHGSFTIGARASCSVPLPIEGMPARWELLRSGSDGMRVRVAAGWDVRIAHGAAVRTRAELEAAGAGDTGRARAHGDVLEVAVPADGRGKVVIGDVKVMFHVVDVAPRAPRPALPVELRATLAERVDRRLLIFAAASLAVHVGVMAVARLNDPAVELTRAEQAMADYEAETATIIDADELPPLPPVPAPPDETPAVPTTKPAVATPAPPSARPSGDRTPSSRPAPPAPGPVDAVGDATRAADALFASDPSGDALGGEAARRKPSGDLGQQLDELAQAHARASLGDGSDRDLPQSTGPRLGTTDGPPARVGDVVTTAPPKPVPDRPRVTLTPPPKHTGEPSVESIIGKIRTTYMSGLVRCYKRAMAEQGAMSGKVALAFEVSERGTVSAASASGVDGGLEQCVEGLMSGWRFTPVVDGDGDPTEVDVKLTLQLRPD